ncbi:MAG TPA: hypothetical protein PKO38_07685 [Bacillota bacterium]|nr:hypothetical protein [Bacillota bacterium]HOB87554.1 hypothetical protein [Bacillota bacterium]HOP69146.1 hypothetical protein [Bacillota bacterium]HPT33798.1 hypothetical protein [Bacillota bacterium]HPZ64339.1 hypothetical protein [Bacillota bacterium]
MKKALVLLSVLLLLSALAGCGINKKISEEVSEQIAEGILGEAGKGKVDVDIEDGKIKFKGEDGSEMTIGEDKWPQGGAADQIPEFAKGKIASASNSAKAAMIQIGEVDEQEYLQYVEELKKAGFDRNASSYADDQSKMYSAFKGEDVWVMVNYGGDTMIITVEIKS